MIFNKSIVYIAVLVLQLVCVPMFGAVKADFTYKQTSKCVPATFVFQNTSTLGSGISYTWNFGNGSVVSTSDSAQLTQTYTSTGTYTVKLVVSDGKVSDSLSATFTLGVNPKAGFSIDSAFFCSVPQTLGLHSASQNATGYAWFISTNEISTAETPVYTLTNSDLPSDTFKRKYSHEVNTMKLPLKLRVSNAAGCFDSVTHNVTVALPVARFMPDKVNGCAPLLVNISDSSKSVYKIDEWTYYINSEPFVKSDNTPISYTFTNPGVYYITERIKSSGCIDTSYAVKIEVGDKLTPDFTVAESEVCNGTKIHISATTNNNSLVDSWKISSANLFDYNFTSKPDTSIGVYTDSLGSRSVRLQVEYNGCYSEISKSNVFSIKGITGNFTQRFSCDSALVYHFKSEITPTSVLTWDVDTATITGKDSIRYKFPKHGDYPVTLTASNVSEGCSLTLTHTIKVRTVKAAFTVNDTILCAGTAAKFNASTSYDYINSCYNEGFLWDFGDKSASRRIFATKYNHVYTKRGNDTVVLVVTADNGCTDTARKVIHILKPEGIYSVDTTSGCVPSFPVKFTNLSTDTTIVVWVWDFGDNSNQDSTNMSVTHTYTNDKSKLYNATFTVYDSHRCNSKYTRPIMLVGEVGDFAADDTKICAGNMVSFSPTTQNLDSMTWTFGDGVSSKTDTTHTYSAKGIYTVTLAASKAGCHDTITKTAYINVEKAEAKFTVNDSVPSCYPVTLSYAYQQTTGSSVANYTWAFNPGSYSGRTASSIKQTYTKAGNYTTSLSVRTTNGCTATSSKNIVVSGPSAAATESVKRICYNNQITYTLDSISNLKSFKWQFGDNSTSTANPATHRYTQRGSITPSVILTSDNCTVTKTLDDIWVSTLVADFYKDGDLSHICNNQNVVFINGSTASTRNVWEINRSTVATTSDMSNTFTTNGIYYIRLTVYDSDNCEDTLTQKMTVVSPPSFSIVGDTVMCYGGTAVTLSVARHSDCSIEWTPTDGLSESNAYSVTASPAATTTYNAVLTSTYGCTTTHQKTVVVLQPFSYTRVPLSDTTIYAGDNVNLKLTVDTSTVSYTWTPAYNLSCTTCSNPVATPEKTVTYKAEMKSGCFDLTESFTIKVISAYYLGAPSAFTPNGDSNNDVFKFESNNLQNFDIRIYNRWGDLVFETRDIAKGWDGMVNGKVQNIDTYTYFVKAETLGGKKVEQKGSFLLLK